MLRQLVAADGNLCAIGDPDQSIYGFRGSNPEIFLHFTRDFPSARTVQLTRNYRSSQTIVAAALQVIAPSTLVTERTLEAMSDNFDRIAFHASPTERAEAEFVVHTIERLDRRLDVLLADSGRVDTPEVEARSFADFAVLYRTEAQADALVEAFARSGIPFQRRSHRRWSDEPAVEALMRVLQESPPAPAAGSQRGCDRLQQAADAVGGEHPEAADYALQLHALAERCGDDVPRFLSELALGTDADSWDPRADRVSLLTLHAAKGLEFPVVFLVGCEDGLLPLRWGPADDADVAEERRLFFVGLTRARDRLYLTPRPPAPVARPGPRHAAVAVSGADPRRTAGTDPTGPRPQEAKVAGYATAVVLIEETCKVTNLVAGPGRSAGLCSRTSASKPRHHSRS